MRFDLAVLVLSAMGSAAASVVNAPGHAQVKRIDTTPQGDEQDLYKRRGGGGGGSRGGGSGGSGGGGRSGSGRSSKSSSSSKTGKSSGSSGGSSGSSTSKSSNSGGTSSKGSGVSPAYGGGRYYAGGASVPYRAGAVTAFGIVPFLLVGSAIAFWPGTWHHGAYMYQYDNPYRYHNATTNKNETREVICGCAQYSVCGCEENNSTAYYDDLVGNGSYAALNKSVINVARVNGTMSLLINGTLDNGTTAIGEDEDSAAPGSMQGLAEALGLWPVVAAVLATVFLA
ncbi:hypothetical protein B0J13DRAFT_234335 [Dactylonectria estremocensis]|uniref:DUF7732 domain-containing protein n=1 Tax=Dactylonectria estremocensis TaxID=1079267 RepID=A0A9P9F6T0_9HYPO|nr:hypothetical protein B0J13DRAFT_234335 [Dactylonectria estremocensis]